MKPLRLKEQYNEKRSFSSIAYSQRQLRVGELVKQNLGEIFIRNEAKLPSINTKIITVTEVRMTPDLKTARVYVIPLRRRRNERNSKYLD